jgi:geranylgeranyl diphosphate synthase, type I
MDIKQTPDEIAHFQKQLGKYQRLIDTEIASYTRQARTATLKQYGEYARLELDSFLAILERGGKRIRGALTLVGYEMSGGRDQALALEVARIVEMIHAYLLIIDDIQDNSDMRRGGPSGHAYLTQYHQRQQLAGNSGHFGRSIAMNSGLAGGHVAQMQLANIAADESIRLKLLSILNRTVLVSSFGQTYDIMNEVVAEVSCDDVERTMEWKTAHYSVLNPLHMGMVLAGADCQATDAITDYAINVGKAYQITDDLLGTFGTEFDSGKSPMDDIRQGKRTLLVVYALEHASDANKNFLLQSLGDDRLTQAEFERCKEILHDSGAYTHTARAAQRYIDNALSSLKTQESLWSADGVQFLRGLANYLPTRTN